MHSAFIENSAIEIAVKFGKTGHAVNTNFEARKNTELNAALNSQIIESINNGTFDKNIFFIIKEIDDTILESAEKFGYSIFFCENQHAVCVNRFSDRELDLFASEGNFEIIHQ